MKVVILGNCQAASYRRLFQAMLPGAAVQSFNPATAAMPDLALAVREADMVFAQRFRPALEEALCTQNGVTRDSFHTLPSVVFMGYHPDCIYLPNIRAAGTGLPSDYQSAIAVAGFLSGRSPRDTLLLYNSYICAAAGYHDRFLQASATLEAHFVSLGFPDLAEHISGWAAGGPFMHTINHPRIDVLGDIAFAVARKAGLSVQTAPRTSDALAKATRWPVYPPIAARLGIAGSLRLVRHQPPNPIDMDWLDYLRLCHSIYRGLSQANLRTPDVENILRLID